MTLVVADSGPIRYLVVIGAISFLPRIYDRIVLPSDVVSELKHANAPSDVRAWASMLPPWIEIKTPSKRPAPILIKTLDRGEVAAILLAQELTADFVLIDEREARKAAVGSGLKNCWNHWSS
jgi:predicted nucleic acid-binding protein